MTLEMIIWMPVLAIAIVAVIQFGIIYAVDKQVAFASHYGAKITSEASRIPTDVPYLGNIVSSGFLTTSIQQHLQASEITNGPCQVLLEHNACVPNPMQAFPAVAPAGCNCPVPVTPVLPGGEPANPGTAYARVTVCVPLATNVPDLLSSFGFSISALTLQHSTVFRIEPDNTTAVPNTTPTSVTGTSGTDTVSALAVNTDVTITINEAATGQVTVNFTGAATDPEDGALAGASLVWSSQAAAPVSLAPTTGVGPVSLVIDTPPNGPLLGPRNSVTYTVRLTSTDFCGDTSFRDIDVTISGRLGP